MTTAFSLIDGVEMNRRHPRHFSIPSPEELAEIRPGSTVKIGVNFDADHGLLDRSTPVGRLAWSAKAGDQAAEKTDGERFWVVVTAVGEAGIVATVDNDLAYTHRHGLKFQDTVRFEPRHVLDIYPGSTK